MRQGGGNDSFTLGKLRSDYFDGSYEGRSQVGCPIYRRGNRREDNTYNVIILGIINAFLGHNPLFGFGSV